MNTYIMDALKQIRSILLSDEVLSIESIDSITGEFEMMKMEIEQHITNMSQNEEYKNMRCTAKNAVQKLSEVLGVLEDLHCANNDEYKELVCEVIDLIDEISY